MGWLTQKRKDTRPTLDAQNIAADDGSVEELPFMTAEEVSNSSKAHVQDQNGESKEEDQLLLVVDKIVYDCSEFVKEHPGGETVIRSFAGKDCSWQFWRFHNALIMEKWGKPLRMGRTEGVANPFEERPRFVGLKKLGPDWD